MSCTLFIFATTSKKIHQIDTETTWPLKCEYGDDVKISTFGEHFLPALQIKPKKMYIYFSSWWFQSGSTWTDQNSQPISQSRTCAFLSLQHCFQSNHLLIVLTLKEHIVTLRKGCQHPADSLRAQTCVMPSLSCLLIHNSPCWQSESSSSSSDKSRGYHSNAAIYRTHLLWVTTIFQPLLKSDLRSYFQQAFHLFPPGQHDFRWASLMLLFLLKLCPAGRNTDIVQISVYLEVPERSSMSSEPMENKSKDSSK